MNYRLNEKDVLITPLGEDGVAFNSNTNEYFSLNETSFKILKGIQDRLSFHDICQQLISEYQVSTDICESEVKNTFQLFIDKKLILEE